MHIWPTVTLLRTEQTAENSKRTYIFAKNKQTKKEIPKSTRNGNTQGSRAMCFQGQRMHLYAKQSWQTGHPLQCTLTHTHTEITNYIWINLHNLKPMKLFMFTTSDHLISGALSKEKGFSHFLPQRTTRITKWRVQSQTWTMKPMTQHCKKKPR